MSEGRRIDLRTAPTAYGSLHVVCPECFRAFQVKIDVGPEGRLKRTVICADCGSVMKLSMTVEDAK